MWSRFYQIECKIYFTNVESIYQYGVYFTNVESLLPMRNLYTNTQYLLLGHSFSLGVHPVTLQ